MSHINFRPWVGKNYLSQGYKGKRILVLGASHYCLDELVEGGRCFPLCTKEKMQDECVNQTIYGIRGFVYNYKGFARNEQTYLCFERAIIGKEATQEEREIFWNGIVFYNYIQFNLDGPRRKIKQEYLAESELAFKEILEEFMPDYFVIWGDELYEKLPECGEHSLLYISDSDFTHVYTYTIQGKRIPGLLVQHPSTPKGKSWPYWHEVYEKFWEIKEK